MKPEFIKCDCGACCRFDPKLGKKIFKEYSKDNLPHGLTAFEFKLFSIKVEDRKRLKYNFIEYLKDSEEISDLIFNIYHEKGIEELEDFLNKSGLRKKINDMVERKRLEHAKLKQEPFSFYTQEKIDKIEFIFSIV